VPFSGLVRPKTAGPLQKLGWHESGSLPDFTQSSQRLSPLDVYPTIRNNEVPFPLHPERFRKVILVTGSRSPPPCPIRNSYPLLSFPPFLRTLPMTCTQNPARIHIQSAYKAKQETRVGGKSRSLLGEIGAQQWRGNPSPTPYSTLSKGSKIPNLRAAAGPKP
jgi:hypothetical protein